MDIDNINDLIRIRSYFAKNDASMFSHWAYKVLGEQIDKLNRELLCYTISTDKNTSNMDSFKRATKMIIKLQDEKGELRIALGNLINLYDKQQRDENVCLGICFNDSIAYAKRVMDKTDANNKKNNNKWE